MIKYPAEFVERQMADGKRIIEEAYQEMKKILEKQPPKGRDNAR